MEEDELVQRKGNFEEDPFLFSQLNIP